MEGILPMSNEQQELFMSIIMDAYQKGITSRDLSVESFFNEIKQKLVKVIDTEITNQKEA